MMALSRDYADPDAALLRALGLFGVGVPTSLISWFAVWWSGNQNLMPQLSRLGKHQQRHGFFRLRSSQQIEREAADWDHSGLHQRAFRALARFFFLPLAILTALNGAAAATLAARQLLAK